MNQVLLISVRLYEGRYHGMGEAEASPARLFQALIAGASREGGVAALRGTFEWLEVLEPPVLGAPVLHPGQELGVYVPNNDLDAVGGDPARVGEVRVLKQVQPRLFDPEVPFLFAWTFEGSDRERALEVRELSARLYQFGRGVDAAWASGELISQEEFEQRLAAYPGRVLRPSGPGDARGLRCPVRGSFESLERRFHALQQRLTTSPEDRTRQLLRQPPKPYFAQVAYDAPSEWRIFQLQVAESSSSGLARVPTERVVSLVTGIRDGAVERLAQTLPERRAEVEGTLVGRRPGARGPSYSRVRIVPLASIGHEEADRRVRRVAVEVPRDCPLPSEDVFWAFSGLEVEDAGQHILLVASWSDAMFNHYRRRQGRGATRWRSVTPVALPEAAARRRIDPARTMEEAKAGSERASEEQAATDSILQALRHAGIRGGVSSVRVQREPFERRGLQVEGFAEGTRFSSNRLWHVELALRSAQEGPLLLGDGRFLGLGVFAPVRGEPGVHVFDVEEGLVGPADPVALARAMRRAVMSRVQAVLGRRQPLPTYFSGHDDGGGPATGPHLGYVFDPVRRRLIVLAAHRMKRTEASSTERRHLETLDEALEGLRELRAGAAGRLSLRPTEPTLDSDPLFAPSKRWASVTSYLVTRHLKHTAPLEILERSLKSECLALGLPLASVQVEALRGIRGQGLCGQATLTFLTAVEGPIALGRNLHLGGGVFAGT